MELTTYLQNMVMLIGLGIADRLLASRRLPLSRRACERRLEGRGARADDGDGRTSRRLQRDRGRDRPRAPAVHAAAVHARLRHRRPPDPDRLRDLRADPAAGAALAPRRAARPCAPDPESDPRAAAGRGGASGRGSRGRSCAGRSSSPHPPQRCCSCSPLPGARPPGRPRLERGHPGDLEAVQGLRTLEREVGAGATRADRHRHRHRPGRWRAATRRSRTHSPR